MHYSLGPKKTRAAVGRAPVSRSHTPTPLHSAAGKVAVPGLKGQLCGAEHRCKLGPAPCWVRVCTQGQSAGGSTLSP